MEVEGFLYDALSPLSPSTASASPSGHPPPPPVDSEPYAVFRNEIFLSAAQPHSPTAAAPDYFSLDLGGGEATVDLIPVHSAAATPVKEPGRRLEGGWFRANCRFRSPMLQLHKAPLVEGFSRETKGDGERRESIPRLGAPSGEKGEGKERNRNPSNPHFWRDSVRKERKGERVGYGSE